MQKILTIFIELYLCAGAAYADISCKKNTIGTTVCRDDNTNTQIRGQTDASGRGNYRTDSGQRIKSRTSATGITTYINSNGNRTKCRKNVLRNTICTDNADIRMTCRTNTLGKMVCK